MSTDKTHLETSRKGYITKLEPSRKGFITNYPNFQQWKKTSPVAMLPPINIYVHIPFCIQRCAYCYYRTVNLKGSERAAQLERYVDHLCREIELASTYFNLGQRPVISIYFGGGTPTVLKNEQLQKIVSTLQNNLKIDLDHGNTEFTVEAEPVTLTAKKAEILQQLKVNRISLGVQSLCDEIIKESERVDTEEKALKAIQTAMDTNAVVNIDLLSGLAGETQETWSYSIKRALETEVQSITVYKMELYANTKYYKSVRNKSINLPSDAEELEFMRFAIEQFDVADYQPWCFFTFTKQGLYQHKHSSSIWRGDDCYAFGTSAFGCLHNRLFQNTNDLEKYHTLIENGELSINRGHHLTVLDQIVRMVVLGMKLLYLDLKMFQEKFGFKLENLCAPVIEQLKADDFIVMSPDTIKLTSKGILHGDYVGKSLSRYLVDNY